MLAIAGGKGGCGKTTTALGLARALADRGYEPLLVDGDCDMPDIHTLAGIERTYGVDSLADGTALGAAVQPWPANPGVSLLTAGRPAKTDVALRRVIDWPGPVLVDSPAGVGPDATRPLRHAEATLGLSTDEPECREDTRQTLSVARELDAPPLGVVLRGQRGSADSESDTVGRTPVLETVDTVTSPLDHHRLGRTWDSLVDSLWHTPHRHRGGISR